MRVLFMLSYEKSELKKQHTNSNSIKKKKLVNKRN
jgi:hypothetical protein